MLKNFTMGYVHPFKDELNSMCRFLGGMPSLSFHARKDDVQRDHRLAVYKHVDGKAIHIATILDHTFFDSGDNDGIYELLGVDSQPDMQYEQERGTLGEIATYLSVLQQTGNKDQASDTFYRARYGDDFC